MDKNLQKQNAFNEKLQKLLDKTQKVKPLNYDNVLRENSELKKQNTLLQVKLKALSMEEKDADLWWDGVQDIGKVCRRYERNERLYRHKIFQMEKVMPSFEYEPLIIFPKPKTSNEEEDKGNTDGAGPSSTKTTKQELGNLKGRKDSPKREVIGKTYTLKQTLKQVEFVLQEVGSHEYAFASTKIGEQI